MITAVDTNILLDVLIPDAPFGAASQQSLDTALQQGTLVLNEVVYAELAAHFPTLAELERFLADTGMCLVPSQPEALARAGKAWPAYTRQRGPGFLCSVCGRVQQLSCQQCGAVLRSRQHLVSDFLIGAHATMQAERLLTRDRGYYRLEVQGQREEDFPKRMFVYNYRTFDRYDCPVASLAVLTDASRAWRPTRYRYRLWGCEMGLRFRVVKLRDYRTRRAELEGSRNPFAVVVMAQLQARATQRRPMTRLQAKVQLIRHLYTRGLTRQQILDLFRFLDWVLTLPEALEQQFQVELAHVEAETHMPYITSIERMGIEKGIQQGEAFMLTRLLIRRFGPLPDWATERLAQASREELEQWAERVLEAQRLEDVFATT